MFSQCHESWRLQDVLVSRWLKTTRRAASLSLIQCHVYFVLADSVIGSLIIVSTHEEIKHFLGCWHGRYFIIGGNFTMQVVCN